MNFTKEKNKDFYLLTTSVENIFLNEYMPGAPEDYTKVYLYGLLYAQSQEEMTHEGLAKQLQLSEDVVDEAWDYWAKMGVVEKVFNFNKNSTFNYDISFINLRGLMYGNDSGGTFKHPVTENGEKTETPDFDEDATKSLIVKIEGMLGGIVSPKDLQTIISWQNDFGASPELIYTAYEYCMERQKNNVNYIEKVLISWIKEGLRTPEEVEKYIQAVGEKNNNYKRILRSLGLNRGPTEAEKRVMDSWFDKMCYNIERVLEACDRTISTTNPSIQYVNKILENWSKEANNRGQDVNAKIISQGELRRYYDYLRTKEEEEANKRKEKVYDEIPRIAEIDREIGELNSELIRKLLTGTNTNQKQESKKMMELLKQERAVLLTDNNYPIDYTDIKYSCTKCNDTGTDENGQRCSCQRERIGEAELWLKKK